MPDYCCIGNFIARQISYNSQMSQKPTMQLWIYNDTFWGRLQYKRPQNVSLYIHKRPPGVYEYINALKMCHYIFIIAWLVCGVWQSKLLGDWKEYWINLDSVVWDWEGEQYTHTMLLCQVIGPLHLAFHRRAFIF